RRRRTSLRGRGRAPRCARAARPRARRAPGGDSACLAFLRRGPLPRRLARMTVRTVVAPPARFVARGLVRARTAGWPPHSRLFALGDRGGWSVDEDARHLTATARRLGVHVAPAAWARFTHEQSVFLASHFEALSP